MENMDKKAVVDFVSDVTNRSVNQTSFLFELVDDNVDKLIELEEKIKNNFLSYCPGDKETVQKVLDMDYGKYWWKFKVQEELMRSKRDKKKSN